MCRELWRPPSVDGQQIAEPMARAVVTDIPDQAIRLAMFSDDGRSVAVPLSPDRALRLAVELIEAATRRLG